METSKPTESPSLESTLRYAKWSRQELAALRERFRRGATEVWKKWRTTMGKVLYSVSVEGELMVMANDEVEARREARYALKDEADNFSLWARQVTSSNQLCDDWPKSMPYNSAGDKTCQEILDEDLANNQPPVDERQLTLPTNSTSEPLDPGASSQQP